MALDAQSNWNIEMSQPLKIPIRGGKEEAQEKEIETPSTASSVPETLYKPSSREVLLPVEILDQIFSYIPATSQSTFWACSLVSRSWYSASISILYSNPHLHGGNFHRFVDTGMETSASSSLNLTPT